jgi:hypothetical protein
MKRAMLPVGVILPLSIAFLYLGPLPQQSAGNPEIVLHEVTARRQSTEWPDPCPSGTPAAIHTKRSKC